ncbi:MerR family transcriptional regulator [Antrihabitans stalactiti]|uniref:MerR family transcriptional regulator n=1 Tax=Antrihabitans stalactiti TaxID=2584121 RepID=A0A848KAY6_9NOCA|nr:MerR family transcriptional regulator [Antrihabitans stalactiti]NMN94648.1 MerR family transcriptional regulator [Antrihabitans stalactiti]
MFSIGDFARHGCVSVRMLRHYDAIGLLQPAHVDPSSGYRFYEADQLARLNRVIALKDLGFTLSQVQDILDDQVSAAELRGMLRLRQSELQAQLASDAARLTQVETRLHIIESEGAMPTNDVVLKTLPAVRVAELTAEAAGYQPDFIGPVIQQLFKDLYERMARVDVKPVGPALAHYEDAPAGDGSVIVHAAMPVNADPRDDYDFAIVDLPEVDQAATILHKGSMDTVLWSWQTLARWIEANGYESSRYARELTIHCPEDPAGWVTELQAVVH